MGFPYTSSASVCHVVAGGKREDSENENEYLCMAAITLSRSAVVHSPTGKINARAEYGGFI